MKNKKILAILTISAIVSAAATGCSFGGDEPEEQVVVTETPAPEATATPSPEPTIAPDVQDSTYTCLLYTSELLLQATRRKWRILQAGFFLP